MSAPAVHAYGPGAAVVEVASATEAASLAAWLRPRLAALDVVPAARTVLVDGVAPADVERALSGWDPSSAPSGPLVTLRVTYDGPDLDFVADRWGVAEQDVGARLASVELVSAFCGFAPGFAYLAGLPEAWSVPRLETPRPRIEPGAVALGGPWAGVYPSASPGGWRVLGRTDAALWDLDRDPPAVLAPGTRVRLVVA